MADEKQPPKPPRRPTLPRVDDPIGDTTPTADDIYPLGDGRRVNFVALAKTLAKVIAILGAALTALIGPAYTAFHAAKQRAMEEAKAVQVGKEEADKRNEAGYQALIKDVEKLKRKQYERELADAEQARAQARRRGRQPGRPTAPLPALPAPPKPLPKDLDTASRQAPSVAGPTVVPLPSPPRALDGGN